MELKIEYIDIDKIKPYEKNPRHNEEAIPYVMNSIKEFGFKVPIIIDKNDVIVAGHTRYKASLELGLNEVPCIIADDLTEDQIKAFRLADNKVAEKAEWDFNMLDAELADLDIDMKDFGFDKLDINADDYGTDFNLPDGEKNEMETMSFCLHKNQKLLIEEALELVKDEIHETFGNENKNGNAIYEVVRQWVEQKK
jgi:hypothetical protein